MKKLRIGIVGRGPAGITAALGLETYIPSENCHITLLDKNQSIADYPGVEYGIQERACRSLERLGLKEKALHRGVRAHEITFYNSRLDKTFRPIKSDADYTRCVVRQEFLQDLAALLKRTEIVSQCNVVAYKIQDDKSVKVYCEHDQKGSIHYDFDLLIVCDGSFSTARKQFFPNSAEKTDRGFSCIYMLIEAKDINNVSEDFLALANGGRSELIMGTISTMTLFPLGKNRLAYGIGFDHNVKESIWKSLDLAPSTHWKDIDTNIKKKIAQKLVGDTTPHDKMYVEALDHVEDWDSYKIYLWKMADTNALTKPYLDEANLILIGDASHAIMPTIGMGASLAIQDAELLTQRLASLLKSTASREDFLSKLQSDVFKKYAEERVPVWEELVRRARVAAKENFIDVKNKKRFAIGPQIPNNNLSKVISTIEEGLRVLKL